jgi:hypothetical protein
MRIIIEEKKFFNQVRQVENIGSDVSDDEMSVRGDKFVRKLVDHVRNFGVDVLPQHQVNGKLATLTASLKPAWDEESVATRLEGLSWLVPVAVSLDQPDIPAFCYEPMMRAAIQDQFSAFAPSLQRLTVGEIRPALERCARQLLSAPLDPPSNDFQREVQQIEYEAFLMEAGKTDQLRKEQKRREVEEFRQREEQAYAAQQQAAHDALWNRNEF